MPGICVGVLSACRRNFLVERRTADLEGRQGDRGQWRCVVVERFGSGDRALELDRGAEIVRGELHVAVLDVVDDAFGEVDDSLGCVGARVVRASDGQ